MYWFPFQYKPIIQLKAKMSKNFCWKLQNMLFYFIKGFFFFHQRFTFKLQKVRIVKFLNPHLVCICEIIWFFFSWQRMVSAVWFFFFLFLFCFVFPLSVERYQIRLSWAERLTFFQLCCFTTECYMTCGTLVTWFLFKCTCYAHNSISLFFDSFWVVLRFTA